jgi:hypothetical protein
VTVRFKMTNRGEVAILPRKDYEALAAKAQEADEDIGTVRLVARARISPARRSFRKKSLTELSPAKMHCVCFASGAVKRSSTSPTRLISDRVTFPTWKADGEREQPQR